MSVIEVNVVVIIEEAIIDELGIADIDKAYSSAITPGGIPHQAVPDDEVDACVGNIDAVIDGAYVGYIDLVSRNDVGVTSSTGSGPAFTGSLASKVCVTIDGDLRVRGSRRRHRFPRNL
jgi:hypothetical protein